MSNIDYIHFRAFSYDFFRRLFIEEPVPSLLQFLQQQNLSELFCLLDGMPDSAAAVATISHYLSRHDFIADDKAFEDLHWDFTQLFIGPDRPLAPPWQSVYTSRDKLLFQQDTCEVEQIYQQNGYFLALNEYEAADHIGFQLDFLYHQSVKTVAKLEYENGYSDLLSLLTQQHNFLHRHLLAFYIPFCQNVIQYAETDFYRSAGTLLHSFLTIEARQLPKMAVLLEQGGSLY